MFLLREKRAFIDLHPRGTLFHTDKNSFIHSVTFSPILRTHIIHMETSVWDQVLTNHTFLLLSTSDHDISIRVGLNFHSR